MVDNGQVVTIGRNNCGQLGIGSRREQRRPCTVSKLKAPIHFIGASATFSVSGSKTSNAVFFWGTRRHPPPPGGRRHMKHRRSRRIHSGNSLHRRASSNASSMESFSDDDSLDSMSESSMGMLQPFIIIIKYIIST